MFTDKKAWIKWALTVASGFPLTNTVNVSSFSVVIKLPNQDRFVSSGDESGVKYTSSDETGKSKLKLTIVTYSHVVRIDHIYLVIFFDENVDCPENYF